MPAAAGLPSVKRDIERSKGFLDSLKKAKDKNPDCLVKPKVTAQSKGIAAYKGVFQSLEEARASDKAICLVPGGDGKLYELRKTELGEFSAPKDNAVEFSSIRAGFTPALPLIPQFLLGQIISFFRCYMNEREEFEAMAHILWDKKNEAFVAHIPEQEVYKARINADLSRESLPEDRYLHYADIHSHNSMAAKFSSTDDQDEKATRLYIVLGRLNRPARFILCDGDLVEEQNLVRQNFAPADLGENKAKALAERYSAVFGLETEYIPSFIETKTQLQTLLAPVYRFDPVRRESVAELVLLLGAVDNNRSRQLCHRVFRQAKELIYIDSGNGEHTGQVVCGVRRNGRTYYPPIGTVYPDVLEDTDKFPTELSCEEAAVSAPQSMAANITAAAAVVSMAYNILALGDSSVRQVTFSTRTVNVRPEIQKKRKRRNAV